ncbi:MAG: hypothetical protein E7641_03085 [Ruminococcaceae bacterium]|nr:hypothetical protein [Oscillospiraceae bacterium]
MKKFLSIFLALTTILFAGSLVSCSESDQNTDNTATTTNSTEGESVTTTQTEAQTTVATTTAKADGGDKVSLDGKRVIFIGNSHTYYGKTVISKKSTEQSARINDKGMFYHLCRLNDMEVSVTNWTFASHNLSDTFAKGTCTKCDGNVNHRNDLTDKNYDYVIIQEGSASSTPEYFKAIFKQVYEFFKEANPDVKFILTLSTRAVENSYQWLPAVDELKESHGLIVADLGNMVWDIVGGKEQVPGATLSYNKNSFIICKSASDGYHPNLLTGYLTSLFIFSAITGESAVGQPYSFAIDASVNSGFNPTSFKSSYYTYQNPTTNFDLILKSEADMKGLQQLVDKYLESQNVKAN